MAGYMPARADFMEEFDNYAEWDLRDIDFVADDSDVLHVLERRYPKEVQDMYDAMRRFARVLGPTEHDKFIESHALEFELRREIARLQEYRRVGIQTFCSEFLQQLPVLSSPKQIPFSLQLRKPGAKVYDRLKRSREEERKKRIMLSEVLQYIQDSNACQQWLHKQAAIDAGLNPVVAAISSSATGRRSAPPLNLTGLPGTDKLNEKEKELCQVVRLVPGAYLEYKAALANECRRQGGLRLAQARALIKIDVNKTRKIYDFLIREGYINKA
ncbi:UNVERIFIED_CONTAM: hypothetical protein FKN15_027726 [Acipenser sinensis]